MSKFSDEFLKKTAAVWQPSFSEQITPEIAEMICLNMISFVKLLVELDEKYNGEEAVSKWLKTSG